MFNKSLNSLCRWFCVGGGRCVICLVIFLFHSRRPSWFLRFKIFYLNQKIWAPTINRWFNMDILCISDVQLVKWGRNTRKCLMTPASSTGWVTWGKKEERLVLDFDFNHREGFEWDDPMQIDIGPIIGPRDHIDFNYRKGLKTTGHQLTDSGEQTMNFNFNFREGTKSKDIYKTTGPRTNANDLDNWEKSRADFNFRNPRQLGNIGLRLRGEHTINRF